jgi:PAS domain S-box-containing protein
MPARGPEKKTVRKKKDGELHCDPASRKRRGTQSAAGRAGRTSKAAAAPPGDAGALYTSLFRDSHTIMLLIDPRDGRIVDANRAAVRFYGYPARTLKSMRIGDVNLLDEGPLRENMGQAERKERRQFHFRHRLAMGAVRDVEVHSGPIRLGGRTLLYSIIEDITERVHAQEAVRKERDFSTAVLDTAGALVVVLDREGRITRFNRACEAMTGYSESELVGRVVWESLVPPEDRQGVEQTWSGLCAGSSPNRHENRWVSKDGLRHLISWSNTVITGAAGEIEYIIGIGVDITEQKRAEEALRDSLETASAMLNAVTESFLLVDTDGVVIAANEAFARGLGTTLDAVIGTSVYGQLGGASAECRRELVREVIRNGHPLRFTDERAGRWLENSIYPIFDSRGRVGRLVIYAQDITDRRRSEETLMRSEALLKSIFQAAPIGIGIVYNRVLGWTNDQIARMLGYSAEELAEKSARIFYDSDEEFERVGREKYVEVRQGGTGVIETRWRRRDGALLDILLSSKAIDPHDLSAGVVFTALDITDRKRSEEALHRYQDDLEQRVRERTSELMMANQVLSLEIEERRRAENALRDSERKLSDIISFLPDATFVVDCDGKVIAWNRSMEAMTGIAAAEMLGKGDYEHSLPFYGKRRPMLIDIALAGDTDAAGRKAGIVKRGGIFFGESYTPALAGRSDRVYLSGTAAPLYDARGRIVGAVESIRDISERKRTEEALRYRDAILEVASFAAERFLKAASWETDILEILARLGTVTGASRVYIFENRTSAEGALLTSQRYEWVAGGIKAEIENPALQDLHLEREGFTRWVEIMGRGGNISGIVREFPDSEQPLLESQGILSIAHVPVYAGDRWWGFIGFDDCAREREWSEVEMEALSVVASTLSAALSRKHVEARLAQTSERLSVVLESLPIVTFAASGDEGGEIAYISGTVEEITGFRPEAFLKDPAFFLEQVHPDDRPHVRSCRIGVASKGVCNCEFRFRAANGSYRWLSEFCRLTGGSEGSIGRIVGMWQDVTEEKRILKESNTRLQQVIQAHKLASLGEIVAGVVHEINNPNSFIAYNIPLLEEIWKLCEPVLAEHAAANPGWGKRDVSFEELRDDMAEIIAAFRIGSDRINRVVSNLKDFARVEEGARAQPVSVNDVVEKTLLIVGGQIRRSVSRLDLDLGDGLPPVQGHFQKLEQVMANLLVNAHQSIPDKERGRIRVSTRHLPRLGAVAVAIEDNGAGMARPVLDRLFEPFFTSRRDAGGTGLGLSVSYGLIREHQGVIGVLSRPGAGSRFTVFLPVRPGTPLNLRPLILPLECDPDRLEELQMEVGGIDDGFAHWFCRREQSAERLSEYMDRHPEVDIVMLAGAGAGADPGQYVKIIRERHPLVQTIAIGGAEQDYTGPGGEKPDIHIEGPPDIRKLKEVLDGMTRQRF